VVAVRKQNTAESVLADGCPSLSATVIVALAVGEGRSETSREARICDLGKLRGVAVGKYEV